MQGSRPLRNSVLKISNVRGMPSERPRNVRTADRSSSSFDLQCVHESDICQSVRQSMRRECGGGPEWERPAEKVVEERKGGDAEGFEFDKGSPLKLGGFVEGNTVQIG